MPQLETIVAMTELEAVNTMLRAIGENPIADLDAAVTGGDTQIDLAVATIRETQRVTLTRGWKFNTVLDFRIANSTVDAEEGFTVPTTLLGFNVTSRSDQRGTRPAKQDDGTFTSYPALLDLEVGQHSPITTATLRFVDRLTNSRIIALADRAQIFIDMIEARDFDEMPVVAQNFVAKRATRNFTEFTIAATDVVGFTDEDVRIAWRLLQKEQGVERPRNLLDNVRAHNIIGRRVDTTNGGRRA